MSNPHQSDDALRSLFQEIILDHYRRPRNRQESDAPDPTIRMNNPTCGDEVALWLRYSEDLIAGISFAGHGCSISQAAASMMTELVQGRSLAEVRRLTDRFRDMLHGDTAAARDRTLGDSRALAGVARFPARVRCAMLPWAALEDAIEAATPSPGSPS